MDKVFFHEVWKQQNKLKGCNIQVKLIKCSVCYLFSNNIYITNGTLYSGIFIYCSPSQYISKHIRKQNPSLTGTSPSGRFSQSPASDCHTSRVRDCRGDPTDHSGWVKFSWPMLGLRLAGLGTSWQFLELGAVRPILNGNKRFSKWWQSTHQTSTPAVLKGRATIGKLFSEQYQSSKFGPHFCCYYNLVENVEVNSFSSITLQCH